MIVKIDTSIMQGIDFLLKLRAGKHRIERSIDSVRETGNVALFDGIYIERGQCQKVAVCSLALSKQRTSNMTADETVAKALEDTVCILLDCLPLYCRMLPTL